MVQRTDARIDTTSRLWDYLYHVKMPYQQTRSVDDIRRTGTNVTGVREIDSDIHRQWFSTMISIAQMADYFKEGVPIRVTHESDVQEIYKAISEHIMAWKARLERGINIGDAPIEDLVLLDNFANTIYAHAKYHFTKDEANALIAQHLNTVQRINASNFFSPNVLANIKSPDTKDGITRINADPEDAIPERDSLSEFFKTRLINLRRM